MTQDGNRPLRVFLSHASEDKSAVRALRNLLGQKNIDVWLDEERILPGQSWENEIRKGLDDADVVIVCLSKKLVDKEGYIQRELKMALRKAEEKPENTIYLIPLKLEECETPSSFSHIQWANMYYKNGEFDGSILNRIMLSLCKRAESLGILWSSFFGNPDQSNTETIKDSNEKDNQPQKPLRTIQLDINLKTPPVDSKKIFNPEKPVAKPVLATESNATKIKALENSSFIVYVIDVSATMGKPLKGKTRLDFVRSALEGAIQEMAYRATENGTITPKYKVAIYAYSDDVIDILNGAKAIDVLVRDGLPKFGFKSRTDTARAFSVVEKLLAQELYNFRESSPPLVCHITDGKFTGENPIPVVQRILEMSTTKGNVIVGNLYICEDLLNEEITNIKDWSGVLKKSDLRNEYAHSLLDMSSTIPEWHYNALVRNGYKILPNAKLLIPGEYATEFIKLMIP